MPCTVKKSRSCPRQPDHARTADAGLAARALARGRWRCVWLRRRSGLGRSHGHAAWIGGAAGLRACTHVHHRHILRTFFMDDCGSGVVGFLDIFSSSQPSVTSGFLLKATPFSYSFSGAPIAIFAKRLDSRCSLVRGCLDLSFFSSLSFSRSLSLSTFPTVYLGLSLG